MAISGYCLIEAFIEASQGILRILRELFRKAGSYVFELLDYGQEIVSNWLKVKYR
jgi:hypothetical protein